MHASGDSLYVNEEKLRALLHSQTGLLEKITREPNDGQPDWFYRFIIHFLTSLELPEKEAKKHYFHILQHHGTLSSSLGRDVGLRVATMDYFLNCSPLLHNPKVVEIELFEQILAMSKEDPKTGCYNETFFRRTVNAEIQRCVRYQQQLSVILLDIDDFKGLNDCYGHIYGDKVLRRFTGLLQQHVRMEDMVARYGGDEFAVLLPQTGRIGARCLAERLRARLIEAFTGEDGDKDMSRVTFSAGIATFPHDATEYEGLIQSADNALYRSKDLGKNRIYDKLEHNQPRLEIRNAEKRNFPRFSIHADNLVDIVDESNLLAVQAHILNISPGGMLLECRCRLTDELVNRRLNIHVQQLGTTSLHNLEVVGNVVRVSRADQTLRFQVALEFEQSLAPRLWDQFRRYGDLIPA